MKSIADLHIHSRFSRATSKALSPEHLFLWSRKKGISVVGTGDCTHPGWLSELRDKLVESPAEGLYQLRPEIERALEDKVPPACRRPVRFLFTGEISCIYKKGGRTRKLHHLILMPNMSAALHFQRRLERIGNIASDGRPILGIDSKSLLEIVLDTSDQAFLIPAHIWTPWFSLFGSKSGFETIEACFEDLTRHVHALETGLSSDPPMNRRLTSLDSYVLVSNSDAHSGPKLGREASLFDTDMDYPHMIEAMKTGTGFSGTIEFFPEEGKYHLDGHRTCGVRLRPEETIQGKGLCPVCGRPVTVGVLHRTYELSDRPTPALSKPFHSLIPLPEILSEILDCGPETRRAMDIYDRLLAQLGPELGILLDVPIDRIAEAAGPLLAEAINRMRSGRVICDAGYDGLFGSIRLFHPSEKGAAVGQIALFGDMPSNPKATRGSHPGASIQRPPSERDTTPLLTPTPSDPILDPLNPEQREAVLYRGGHLLIAAGPGTGKTLTLTHRIAHLIREGAASPGQLLCLTFTRKAAREMGERLERLLPDPDRTRVRVATFHRFCLDLLRKHGAMPPLGRGFGLCSEIEREAMAREVIQRSGPGRKPSLSRFFKALAQWRIREALQSPEGPEGSTDLFPLFREYQQALRQAGMLDLDELEVETLGLLRDGPKRAGSPPGEAIRLLFIDEYQDTNPVQVELLKRLVQGQHADICAIGDPDQAIYGFRGADARLFHRFGEDFPGAATISLARNYRSARPILEGSAPVVQRDHPLSAESAKAGAIAVCRCRTESEEAEMVVAEIERLMGGTSHFSLDSGQVSSHDGEQSLGFGDIAVLYRLNAQGDALVEAMDRAGIPFVRSGESPLVSLYPVNLLWRWLQMLRYPAIPYYRDAWDRLMPAGVSGSSNERIRTLMEEGRIRDLIEEALPVLSPVQASDEGDRALSRMRTLAEACEGDPGAFLDALSMDRGIDHALLEGDRVNLMSLHAGKGLEWEVVFITGVEDRLLPCTLFEEPDMEEERRLFYVGMTRARSRLILSHVRRRALNGRPFEMNPSPFLDLIPETLRLSLDRRGWTPKKPAARQLTLF